MKRVILLDVEDMIKMAKEEEGIEKYKISPYL